MAFVLKQTNRYDWPVLVKTPQAGGTFQQFEFIGQFTRLRQDRIDEILCTLNEQRAGRNVETPVTDAQLVDEVFQGWADITAEDGSTLVVSPENRDLLLNVPGIRAAVIQSWFESISGIERKNSSTPLPTGSAAS